MKKIIYTLLLLTIITNGALAGCDDEVDEEDDSSKCEPVTSFDFEVFGKVQGVYFRKHTEEMAKKLNLVGFVENTKQSTVVGTVQGAKKDIDQMEHWLRNVGSPKSRIDKMDRKNYRILQKADYSEFAVKK